jgi:hypothetical protein
MSLSLAPRRLPVEALITQGSMTEDCWWSRFANESGVFWKGNNVV